MDRNHKLVPVCAAFCALFAAACLNAGEHVPGGYHKHDDKICGPKWWKLPVPDGVGPKVTGPKYYNHDELKPAIPTCYKWELCEEEEVVYTVTYKTIKKKVQRPVIKELTQPVNCSVYKPVAHTVLRDCPIPQYGQDKLAADEHRCQIVQDECGNCQAVDTVESVPVTCLTKKPLCVQVPTIEWELVKQQDTYNKRYLVQEMKDVEIEIEVPVKTPKVIKKKVWRKVPVCVEQGCPTCETCQGCQTCSVPMSEVPTEIPVEVPAPQEAPAPPQAQPDSVPKAAQPDSVLHMPKERPNSAFYMPRN